MLKYTVVSRKNPANSDVKWYAQPVAPEPIDLRRIGEQITELCTVTQADVVAVLEALENQMTRCLQEGRSVRFGNIGSFRSSLHSSGALKQEQFSNANINRVSIVFVPSRRLRWAISPTNPEMKFSKVTPKPATPGGGGAGA